MIDFLHKIFPFLHRHIEIEITEGDFANLLQTGANARGGDTINMNSPAVTVSFKLRANDTP
jgi:hypothetical protein